MIRSLKTLGHAEHLDAPQFSAIERALRRLDVPKKEITARALQRVAIDATGMGSAPFARLFEAWAGVPFAALVAARLDCDSLQAAAFELRLRGANRLASRVTAVTEAAPRSPVARLSWGVAPSPFGMCLIASSERGLVHLSFVDRLARDLREFQQRIDPWKPGVLQRDDREAAVVLRALFAARRRAQIELHMIGSEFQRRVWRALLAVSGLESLGYSELAAAAGHASAARAIGSAVGANRLGWIVPCHHVLRRDGGLGGFHWGVDRKRAMLVWESLAPPP